MWSPPILHFNYGRITNIYISNRLLVLVVVVPTVGQINQTNLGRIQHGQYVAQAQILPSERGIKVDGEKVLLKLDVRDYVYEGEIQLLVAFAGQVGADKYVLAAT